MIHKLNNISSKIIKENITSIQSVYNLKTSVLFLKGLKAYYFLDNNTRWIDEFNKNIKEFYFWYEKALVSAETREEKSILETLMTEFNKYLEIHHTILVLSKENRAESIQILLNDAYNTLTIISNKCESLIQMNEKLIIGYSKQVVSYLEQNQVIGYCIIIGFFFLSLFLSIILAKSITDPLKLMTRSSEMVVEDQSPYSGEDHNELTLFKKRFDTVIHSLNEKQKKLIESERRAAIGEIAAGVSHELNNPVGIIYGFAERLLQKEDTDSPRKKMLEQIYTESERCKSLLKEFLDFAKPIALNLMHVSINDLIKEVTHMFSMREENKDIRITLTLPENNYEIIADIYRLKQVFINLLINAIDAVKGKENREIAIGLQILEEYCHITIRDNGQGIKEDELDKIFKPFYSTKHKGIGLGLSISKDIIEKHKGKISVESEYMEWTEFRIILPLAN